MPAEHLYSLRDLLRVMERLRDPQHGCPWDVAQDFDTIVPSTLEEAYELVAAIEHGDFEHVSEELGDLLFQVIFYAQLGRERSLFDFPQIVNTLVTKLIRRHPHVFADGELEGVVANQSSVDSVKESWEAIKGQEREQRDLLSVLADVPTALPSLSRAQKLQKRVANIGFDWSSIDGVLDKLGEEIEEYQQARSESVERQEQELGDILFTCVNLARHNGLDAEAALRRANSRFEARFLHMETAASARGKDIRGLGVDQLNQLWEQAKEDA